MILNETDLDVVCGGGFGRVNSGLSSNSEMAMISLQSLVSQRSTELQLITEMMSSTNGALGTIAGNIKG